MFYFSRCSEAQNIKKFHELISPIDSFREPEVQQCSKVRHCRTLNCPWKKYPVKKSKYIYNDCISVRDVKKSRFESSERVEYVPQSMERPDKIFNVTFNFAIGSR